MVVVLWKVQWLGDFVLGDQGLGVAKIPFRLPGVFSRGVPLPPDQESAVTRLSSMSKDHLDFIFLFAIY